MDIQAFFKITYGIYIVCSGDGNNRNGHVSNTVFQVTADPPQFIVATHKNNLTTDYIRKSRAFSVSVIDQQCNLEFLGPWGFKSGRVIDKFKNMAFKKGKTGTPVLLEKALAFIECGVVNEIDAGTHILFIGTVIDAEVLNNKGVPMTYQYYREVIKGISPEYSPTYTSEKNEQQPEGSTATMLKESRKYQCKICGYIYDPEEGDPHAGIEPGTAFEDIPDDWVCPICGVTKKDFVPID